MAFIQPRLRESIVTLRSVAVAVSCLFPMSQRKRRLLNRLGHDIADGASLAPCLVWDVDRMVMQPGSVIRAFTVIAGLRVLDLGTNTTVGAWNRITSSHPHGTDQSIAGTLYIGDETAVTSRHELDATGGIRIGSFSGVGGFRTAVITSVPDPSGRPATSVAPVVIGDRCLINTNCTILPGANIEDRVIVGAHSLIEGTLRADGLYLTPRARRIKMRPETNLND